MMQRFTDNLT